MSDQPPLFENLDEWGDPAQPPDWPQWFRAGKTAVRLHCVRVAQGRHPMGDELGPEESRCGTCRSLREHRVGKVYWKCDKVRPWTGGLATDVRLKWRGCRLWEEQE